MVSENRETIADIVSELRNKTGDMYDCTITTTEDEFHDYADRIEAAAKRAYNKIDSAVCGIDSATSADIDDVRKAMDETIGDYYE